MRIDAHQHLWSPARGDYGWMDGPGLEKICRDIRPEHLAPVLKAHGIERTVLVQAAPTLAETHYMLGLADATEWIAKVVGWVDFESPADLKPLKDLARHSKFSGVRPMIQDIPDPNWMLRPELGWAFDAVTDLGLTFDALGFPVHAPNLLRLLDRYPKMRVVIDHCLKPQIRGGAFDNWSEQMARLARETGAFCKLSGLATEAKPGWTAETLQPYVAHVLACFGPDRVMWGSDWPVLDLNGNYANWLQTARALVPEIHHPMVFGGTAARFYRIG